MADSTKKKMNGCLIGCLSVVVLIVIVIVLLVVLWFVRGEQIMQVFFEQARTGMVYMMTEDHTEEEKQMFVRSLDNIFASVGERGLKQTVRSYNDSIVALQNIIADQRITRQESASWQATFSSDSIKVNTIDEG